MSTSPGISPFVYKAYQLVSNRDLDDIVSWNADGTTLVVWDTHKFETDVLPRFFKHNNFSSFVRQLNTYGFRKVPTIDPQLREFAHDHFQKDCPASLGFVKRKTPSTRSRRSQSPMMTVDVRPLPLQPAPAVIPLGRRSSWAELSVASSRSPAENARDTGLPARPAAETMDHLTLLHTKQKATDEKLTSLCTEWKATMKRLDALLTDDEFRCPDTSSVNNS